MERRLFVQLLSHEAAGREPVAHGVLPELAVGHPAVVGGFLNGQPILP